LKSFLCDCEEKKVWADIQYNKEVGPIQNDRVISVINGLLSNRGLQERALNLRDNDYWGIEKEELSDSVKGCQMNGVLPPPIKFY